MKIGYIPLWVRVCVFELSIIVFTFSYIYFRLFARFCKVFLCR